MNSLVEILLSTFNGERYLEVQLNSIFEQDYTNWKLLVRDDGSSDNTLTILNNYIQKYPGKIILLNDTDGNLGYSNSFLRLLRQSSADYVMYCDQDDYWYPDKISTMLSVIIKDESLLPGMARIVFSDLQLADAELKITSQSFLSKMRYYHQAGLQVFFLKNYIPGCNLLFNRSLIQQALNTDNIINFHDHWLLIVCGSIGKISSISKPLMKYRIHNNNAIGFIGEKKPFLKQVMLFIKDVFKYGFSNKKYRNLLYSKNIRQIQNICECFPASVSEHALVLARIDSSGFFSRKMRNISNPYIIEGSLLKKLTYIICF